MKILLTGANGQVGQAICELAARKKVAIIALSRQELDVTDAAQVEEVLAKYQPQFVINTAAYTAVDRAEQEQDSAYQINAVGCENLAKSCAKHHAVLMHLSTDYVFDGTKPKAYVESDLENPASVYGATKYQGEEAIKKFAKDYIILRVSWVFGVAGQNFVKTILRLAQENKTLKIVADQKGCPTSAHSIALALFELIKQWPHKKLSGIYHYCNQEPTTWFGFTQAIIDLARHKRKLMVEEILSITTDQMPRPAKRPMNSILDCGKIKHDYDIEQVNWLDELKEVLDRLM